MTDQMPRRGDGVIRSITIEQEAARSLLLSCKDVLEGDEQAIADTIEGETSLLEAIDRAVKRIGDLKAHRSGIVDYVKALSERSERFEMQEARIKAAILNAIDTLGLGKIELPHATVYSQATPDKVVITAEHDIPTAFMVEPEAPPPKPDKRALLAALKGGATIPGAQLSNGGRTLQIRSK